MSKAFVKRSCLTASFAAILFLLSLPSVGAQAPAARAAMGRIECRSMNSALLGRAVRSCLLLPPSYDAEKANLYPVLYFLHGLGQNEQMFVQSHGRNLVEDLWQEHKLREFLIVTPDGDASFFINSRDGRVPYEDFFLQELIPYIEREYRVLPGRAARGIAGFSMGGYGALHLAFRHPQLFNAVSATSAALLDKPPDIRIAAPVFGTPPDLKYWERSDPLMLARSSHLSGLKIYFDCGTEDDFGFERGARQLDQILTSRHIPHEAHLDSGRHDAAYFLSHLPASLKFQSQAFASSPEPTGKK